MNIDFDWKWNDPSHFEAHRDEFSRPVEEILKELRPKLLELGEEVRKVLAGSAPGVVGGVSSGTGSASDGLSGGDGSGAGTRDSGRPTESAERHWVHAEWELDSPTGYSGLREVEPRGDDSFWAYRAGRKLPSHLTVGVREETNWVCLWGWAEPGAFVIHTIYPGRKAPREIHDPDLALSQLPEAIEFWRIHAIVTEEGAFLLEPAP